FQRVGDLPRNLQRFFWWNRTSGDPAGQCLAGNEFHNEKMTQATLLKSVDGSDVGAIQRRQNPSLALETGDAFRVMSELFRQAFDRPPPAQLPRRRLIRLSHAAASEVAGDFIMLEPGPNHRRGLTRHLISLNIALRDLFVHKTRKTSTIAGQMNSSNQG